jgi:putative addiction module component (TIGR02574 family)
VLWLFALYWQFVICATIQRSTAEVLANAAPAFIIELSSPSASRAEVQQRMEQWMANGGQLGWLIDPYQRHTWIYEAGAAAATGKRRRGSRHWPGRRPRTGIGRCVERVRMTDPTPDALPLTAAQQTELDRRLETLDEDRREGLTWEALKAEMERRGKG